MCLPPCTRQSPHICTEIHKGIHNHRGGHDTMDTGPILRVALKERVDKFLQTAAVGGANGEE